MTQIEKQSILICNYKKNNEAKPVIQIIQKNAFITSKSKLFMTQHFKFNALIPFQGISYKSLGKFDNKIDLMSFFAVVF